MKIAVCIVNSPRAIDYAIPTLYKNVIDYLEADVFCMFTIGEHNNDIYRISKINKKVIEKNFWDPKEFINFLPKIFWNTHIKFAKLFPNDPSNNYLNPIYISKNSDNPRWFGIHPRYTSFKLLEMMNKYINKYDYFIITRSDLYFLFPIINETIIQDNQEYILHYDTHSFGGINAELVILSRDNFIKWTQQIKYFTKRNYINKLIDCMKNIENIKRAKNAELCTKCIIEIENFKIKSMATNSFIIKDLNILEKIEENSLINYYKHSHYFDCIENKKLWDNGYRWFDDKEKIILTN